MTVFIELVTDAFDEVFAGQVLGRTEGLGSKRGRAGAPSVRRPVRGIEIKDDTYAFLRVVLPTGEDLPLLSSSSRTGTTSDYTNFILQSVNEARMERHQIVETFGDAYIFFFGEHPRFLECTALLINSNDFNWRAEWWENYEKYLRGTKLVELGARCYMFWDDIVVEGYMVQAQCSELSEAPYTVQLQFKFFVTKYRNVSLYNVEQFPVRASVRIPDGIELTAPDSFYQLQSAYQGAAASAQGVTAISREVERSTTTVGNEFRPGNENNNITTVVRQLPPSFLQDPAVWRTLVDTFGIVSPINASAGVPVRGLIADNTDEYVQQSEIEPSASAYYAGSGLVTDRYYTRQVILGGNSAVTGQEESDDLTRDCVNSLEAIGCRADDPTVVHSLGLGPNFSSSWRSSAGAFASGGVSAGASVGVHTGVSVRTSALVTFGASAGASASSGLGGRGMVTTSSYGTDPLGQVYGRTDTDNNRFSADRPRYVEGTGDYSYGYGQWAAYGGVGFGQVGFGMFGGAGFGSASGAGDPGFRDPDSFTHRNVRRTGVTPNVGIHRSENTEEGFNRFLRTRSDNTALTRGEQLGACGGNGSGSIQVGGRQSAFSFMSLEGSLSAWVVAEAHASSDSSVHVSRRRIGEVENARRARQSEGLPR